MVWPWLVEVEREEPERENNSDRTLEIITGRDSVSGRSCSSTGSKYVGQSSGDRCDKYN